MDVRWRRGNPDDAYPGDVGLTGMPRLKLPLLNLYNWFVRRCAKCGTGKRLARTDILVRAVPKREGEPTISFRMVGWLCDYCAREQDG